MILLHSGDFTNVTVVFDSQSFKFDIKFANLLDGSMFFETLKSNGIVQNWFDYNRFHTIDDYIRVRWIDYEECVIVRGITYSLNTLQVYTAKTDHQQLLPIKTITLKQFVNLFHILYTVLYPGEFHKLCRIQTLFSDAPLCEYMYIPHYWGFNWWEAIDRCS
jgi:hypothetical protein